MRQCLLNRLHIRQISKFFVYKLFVQSSEVVGCDNRIREQPALFAGRRGNLNQNAALMRLSGQIAGYHRYNYLRQIGLQIIGLNNENRTLFRRLQI